MKNIIKLLLVLSIIIACLVSCGNEKANEIDTSDLVSINNQTRNLDCDDVAKSFIKQRAAEEGSAWSDKTRYSGGIVLYSPDKKYCGFHFDLETDDKPTGYIRVLFFDDGFPYVDGYSEEAIDLGFTPNPTMYIGNGEYIRKNDSEDFYRSTKTAATYTEEEVRAQFEALKNSNNN